MHTRPGRNLVLLVVLSIACTPPGWADYATGYAAFQRGDYTTALQLWTTLAQQGEAVAQYSVGILYATGLGVTQSYATAATWFRQAAEQGYAEAQYNLGLLYARGDGLSQDDIRAYMWLYRASLQGLPDAARGQAAVAARMQAWQIAEAQAMAERRQAPPTSHESASVPLTRPPGIPKGLQMASDGTGFIVSRQGYVVTNRHVVEDCIALSSRHRGKEQPLRLVVRDPQNDLAVLQQAEVPPTVATLRIGQPVRPGESVVVVGFPLHGLLASEANVTTGTVSALAGLKDDTRFLQITAPVQSGNSGGPLFDQSGHIIGVVTGKLDARRIMEEFGDIPQNVNFAIKVSVIRQLLDTHAIDYDMAPSLHERASADIGAQAQQFTVLVQCWK